MGHRQTASLPQACRGLIEGRPLVFWSVVAANLAIWLMLMILMRRLFGA